MGVFHRATITPSKAEIVAGWITSQQWGPTADTSVEVVGAFRFDDPDNQVGLETHLAMADGVLYQVPLTYRNEPLAGAEAAFIGEMEHSVLGTRWVYDGLGDERFVMMLAAVAMTGQGEALGMAVYDGRWNIAPANVRLQGGGWSLERVPVDGFETAAVDQAAVVFTNDRFEMTFSRLPVVAARPQIGLTATWETQAEPVVLAQVRERL